MAKRLDWEKLHRESKLQSNRELDQIEKDINADKYYLKKHLLTKGDVWLLKGKYFGKKLNTIPSEYLGWIIDKNFKIYRELAEKELRRRYEEISNT